MVPKFLREAVGQVGLDERGQDLFEYSLLIGLVAVAVIGVVMLLGDGFSALLGAIAGEVGP